VSCLLTMLGLGGVMVICVVAFRLCYGSASIAVSTRLVIVKKEIVIEGIAFLFGTSVAESK